MTSYILKLIGILAVAVVAAFMYDKVTKEYLFTDTKYGFDVVHESKFKLLLCRFIFGLLFLCFLDYLNFWFPEYGC